MAGDQIQVNVSWRDMPLMTGVVLESIDQQMAFIQTDIPMPVWTDLEISMVMDDGLRVPAKVEQVKEACRSKPHQSEVVAGMQLRLEAEALTLLFGRDQDADQDADQVTPTESVDFESLQPAPIVGDTSADPEVLEDSSPDLVASVSTSRISRDALEPDPDPEPEIQSVATGEIEISSSAQAKKQSMRASSRAPDKVIIDIGDEEPQDLQGEAEPDEEDSSIEDPSADESGAEESGEVDLSAEDPAADEHAMAETAAPQQAAAPEASLNPEEDSPKRRKRKGRKKKKKK